MQVADLKHIWVVLNLHHFHTTKALPVPLKNGRAHMHHGHLHKPVFLLPLHVLEIQASRYVKNQN